MLLIPSRFALALAYSLTFGQTVTSVALPAPDVETTTITVKEPQATMYLTTQLPPAVTTETIVITAPVNQISSIAGGIPKSYQQILSETPGAIIPFTINGYTTSIVIPASASIPTDATIPAFTPVIIPAVTISGESARAVTSLSALSSSLALEHSAIGSSITSKASEELSKATSAVSAASSAATSLASDLKSKDITILPIPIPKPTKAASVLSSAESALSTKAAAASSDLSSAASKASTALSGASSEIASASSAASHASTKIASVSESARSRLSAATDSLTSILSDTASLSGLTTSTVSSPTNTATATESASSSASESGTSASSSSSSGSRSPTSTAAPASGAVVATRPIVASLLLGLMMTILVVL